jgi:hypothetical protein
MKKIILLIALALASFMAFAQKADNYSLQIKKKEIGTNAAMIKCSFDVLFCRKDSVVMSFGGNLGDLSVTDLKIRPKGLKYSFNPTDKTFTIFKDKADSVRIELSYNYMNATAAIVG